MHLKRMRARVASAEPIATGYVSSRRLAFHKRSVDGSGKADAAVSNNPSDRVWGVVYSLTEDEKRILDGYEFVGVGYDCESVTVHTSQESIQASIYTARSEAIQADLNPYTWYLQFVVLGAIANRLPADYVQSLRQIISDIDQDHERHLQNMRLTEA